MKGNEAKNPLGVASRSPRPAQARPFYVLDSEYNLNLVTALLMLSGAQCNQCGFGTRATSKKWARCKRCQNRVQRVSMEEAGEKLRSLNAAYVRGMRRP